MKVLVGCERSGIVREEFRKLGHDAWSCDVLPSEIPSDHHIQDDVRKLLHENWDLGIFFPDYTHICISGARHFSQKIQLQESALDFVARLMVAPIPHIAIENPVGVISSRIRLLVPVLADSLTTDRFSFVHHLQTAKAGLSGQA